MRIHNSHSNGQSTIGMRTMLACTLLGLFTCRARALGAPALPSSELTELTQTCQFSAAAIEHRNDAREEAVLGIDFGTESIKVSMATKTGVEMLLNNRLKRRTPTMVAFRHNRTLLGDDAVLYYDRHPLDSFADLKASLQDSQLVTIPALQQRVQPTVLPALLLRQLKEARVPSGFTAATHNDLQHAHTAKTAI